MEDQRYLLCLCRPLRLRKAIKSLQLRATVCVSEITKGNIKMAFIDRIYRGNGHSERAVNLAGSVGINGKNLFYDVMLIQTLFHYIAETPNIYNIITGEQILGLGEDSQGFTYRLPKITGVMDTDTVSTISQFQISNASSLLTGNRFDGLIEPAKYRGRTLRRSSIGSRLMAITLLHVFARECENARRDGSYIDVIRSKNVHISDAFAIDDRG